MHPPVDIPDHASANSGKRKSCAGVMMRGVSAAALCAFSLMLSGCDANDDPSSSGEGITDTVTNAAFCAIGGAAGYFGAQAVSDEIIDDVQFAGLDEEQLQRAFIIGASISLCGGAVHYGNALHAELTEAGKRRRQEAIDEALATSQSRQYEDPEKTDLGGEVRVVETTENNGRTCKLVEDRLADPAKSEQVYVKKCRTADGGWETQLLG